MKKLITFLSAFALLVLPLMSQTQFAEKQETKKEKIDALMTFCSENSLFNGTILVQEKGAIIYKNAFGYANRETKEKLIPESAFYLASVSKQFTTMAIMILKEKKKLSFDDKLSRYFPEFPDYANKVSIKHLMTHTSGIPDHFNLGAYKPDLSNSDVLSLLIKQDALNFEPGEKYSYSNGAYVLLALIVEKASGMPFYQFMKKNIFDPLGMKNTLVFDESKPQIKNRAIGYNESGQLADYDILTTGAGGMYSTVEDLFLWDQALYTKKLISKKTLKKAYTPFVLNNGEISNYGFGWSINEGGGKKSVAHSGSLSGFRTFIRRNLSDKNAYMLLSNKGAAVAMDPINAAIGNILVGEAYDLPKISITNKMIELLEQNDVKTAIAQTKKILKEKPDDYEVDEDAINTLGYQYLNEKNMDAALAIFAYNIELFPSAFNVYDSMGEALLMKGDKEGAIKHYKKSIELNPNNENGKKVLEKIGVDISKLSEKIAIPTEVLDSYLGDYQLAPNFILNISREGEQLYIFPAGQRKSEIFPASETRFFSKIVDAQITFNKDDEGKVVSLTLHQGGDHLAKKIK